MGWAEQSLVRGGYGGFMSMKDTRIPIADERRHAYVRMRESMIAWPNPGHCRLDQAIKSEINLNLP